MITGGATEASALAIAVTWVADSVDSDPMPPTLPPIAAWMRAEVAPPLVELASAPWQLAQYKPYSVGPSVITGGATEASAEAIAWTSAAVSLDRDPMPPALPPMAAWMRAAVAPPLVELARTPWHPAQFDEYSDGPSGVTGVGVGVPGVSAVTIAWTSTTDNFFRDPIPPASVLIASCNRAMLTPCLVDVASGPWQLAQLDAYSVAPSGAGDGGVVEVASALATAWISAALRDDRRPIPPTSPLIAFWIPTVVAPRLAETPSSPWQPAHAVA